MYNTEMAEKCQCFLTFFLYPVTSAVSYITVFRENTVKLTRYIIIYFDSVRISADIAFSPPHRIHTVAVFRPVGRHNIPYNVRYIFSVFYLRIRVSTQKLRQPVQVYLCGKFLQPSQAVACALPRGDA